MPVCPQCKVTSRQIKQGFTKSRKQRFRCSSCGKRYVPGSAMRHTQAQKDKILDDLLKTYDLTLVANTYGVSSKTIRRWYKEKFGELFPYSSRKPEAICPYCNSPYHQAKCGTTEVGNQRYRCLQCRHTYVLHPSKNNEFSRKRALSLYLRHKNKKIAANMAGVSYRTMCSWVKAAVERGELGSLPLHQETSKKGNSVGIHKIKRVNRKYYD